MVLLVVSLLHIKIIQLTIIFGYTIVICFQTLTQRGLKANEWVQKVAGVIEGTGGGRDVTAQCSGPGVEHLSEASDAARKFADLKLQ